MRINKPPPVSQGPASGRRKSRSAFGGPGLFYFPVALLLFWGCASPGRPAAPLTRHQAMVHASRTYALGKIPDQDREQAFQDLLAAAYASALKRSGSPEIGFSYSMAPKGAVYAFSEVEVSCLIKETDAAWGGRLCSDFFNAVDAGITKIRGK